MCSIWLENTYFLFITLESYKFQERHFSCIEIDCRHRRKPETRFSWSKTRFMVILATSSGAYFHFFDHPMTFSWIVPIEILSESTQFFLTQDISNAFFRLKASPGSLEHWKHANFVPEKNVNSYNRKFGTVAWGARATNVGSHPRTIPRLFHRE